ncbi:hypothetical protein [Haliea sp. E17]|uniref:hypothetical protein n=1 Tax=Haliea sp. E17 TaxID=3401576 RepID=UPI003AAD5186
MNSSFKPLGLAAAVATATAGYAGVVNAQASLAGNTQLGDLALVPYYTTLGGYATGVNIINTSDKTQAVKVRFRRAPDSMDALDFNVVLSPYDMYTGYIAAAGDDIRFYSNDNSCTAPGYTDTSATPYFEMPSIYRTDADTGYIEIISMGSPTAETMPVAVSAKHDATGVPYNCDQVRDNFFADGVAGTAKGVVSSVESWQFNDLAKLVQNTWEASPDSLKVSYFIKSDDSGVEFGNNAVHIAEFMDGASITNQEKGVFSGDLQGFDHPDLNGGAPASTGISGAATYGLYAPLRWTLGADALINDWSANDAGPFSVDTDWVVTIPGQYVMLDLPDYLRDLAGTLAVPPATDLVGVNDVCLTTPCDNRDIPMTATFTVYDREERGILIEEGDLVVSPAPPPEISIDALPNEVNVIEWGAAPVLEAPEIFTTSNTLGSIDDLQVPEGATFGWVNLAAVATTAKTQQICEYDQPATIPLTMTCTPTDSPAPMIGFVAWQRNFDALPAANYGRIVEHSRVQSSS